MRITSRFYIIISVVFLGGMICSVIGFFSEKQTFPFGLLFIGIELLLGLFLWATLNFIDVYQMEGGRLECRYHGTILSIPPTAKIVKLPVYTKGIDLKFGSIRYYDETGRQKLKFFMVSAKVWPLILGLKA